MISIRVAVDPSHTVSTVVRVLTVASVIGKQRKPVTVQMAVGLTGEIYLAVINSRVFHPRSLRAVAAR